MTYRMWYKRDTIFRSGRLGSDFVKGAKYLNFMQFEVPTKRILTRLGYKEGITAVDEKEMKEVQGYIARGVTLCESKGVFIRLPILSRTEDMIQLDSGIVINSRSIVRFLEKSTEVVLIAATIGRPIIDAITEELRLNNASGAVVLDSTASQMADAAIGSICQSIHQMLLKEGKCLTKARYSPGFGDFGLEYQKMFYDILEMDRIGVRLTEHYMMIPEKSVTAISGVELVEGNRSM